MNLAYVRIAAVGAAIVALLTALPLQQPYPTAAQTQTASQATTPTSPDDELDGITYDERSGYGGPHNVVKLVNRQDDRLRVKGNIQLNRIRGDTVAPANVAIAGASCSDCETFSIALQLNLIQENWQTFVPENAAVAANAGCTRCHTVAYALQYLIPVDDPSEVPRNVDSLVRELDQELNRIHSDRSLTLEMAEQRLVAIVIAFSDLAMNLVADRQQSTATNDVAALVETVTPTPVATPTLTATLPTAAPTAVMTGTPHSPAPSSATTGMTPEPTATPLASPMLAPTSGLAEPTPTAPRSEPTAALTATIPTASPEPFPPYTVSLMASSAKTYFPSRAGRARLTPSSNL